MRPQHLEGMTSEEIEQLLADSKSPDNRGAGRRVPQRRRAPTGAGPEGPAYMAKGIGPGLTPNKMKNSTRPVSTPTPSPDDSVTKEAKRRQEHAREEEALKKAYDASQRRPY